MLRHVYDVSNMDKRIVYRVCKLESLNVYPAKTSVCLSWSLFARPFDRKTNQPLFWALCYIFKRSSAGDGLFLLTTPHSLSLFLHHENARNVVQGNPKFSKISRGSMPPDSPTSLHLHCPHAPPRPPLTNNPGYAPV